MQQVKLPELSRTIRHTGIVVIFVALGYFLYPFVIVELVGKDIPHGWSPKLGEMNFSEIHNEIGQPQFNMSAKDYQDWAEYHWWGVKMLKISSSNCCGPAERPSDIRYVVYVNGKYKPAYQKYLFDSER